MKYKERVLLATVLTFTVLFTFIIYNNHSGHDELIDGQCYSGDPHMTADWTVDSIYNDLNFTLNRNDGLYTVIEKTHFGIKTDSQPNSQPLKIIVVPHSHNDPGWLWTFEDYYTIRTRGILTNTISALKKYPDFRMIWTETVFLDRWWKESPESLRSDFKNLVRNGKIEILSGGWVSVDEATTHYTSVLDQLVEGHVWLKEHFGVFPNTSWSIDPFGYSSTLPYIWQKAGMKQMAILRIHGAVKGYMGHRKMLTYKWRQQWDKRGDKDILCHVEPYTLYNIECSCGPDTDVCRVLDFSSVGNFPADGQPIYFGKNRIAKDFKEFARLVAEQYKKKASLYSQNVILMPHGDDFRYIEEFDFEINYNNMKRLIDYINYRKDWNIEMKFGTVGEYFQILRSEEERSKNKFVSLTGDFFTYSDKENDYWSGYFTTRPFDKRMIRELLEYLRTTETMTSLIYIYLIQNAGARAADWEEDWKAIQVARRTHSLVQHHDAITGTSTATTVMDFEIKIFEAINLLIEIIQKRVTNILSPTTKTNIPDLTLTREISSPTTPFETKILRSTSDITFLVLINSYSKSRMEVITIHVDTFDLEIFDGRNRVIPYEVSPIWSKPNGISRHGFEISFEVDISAIGISVYKLRRKSIIIGQANIKQKALIANITYVRGMINNVKDVVFEPKSNSESVTPGEIFSIENQYLKLSFSKLNGALQTMCVKSTKPHCVKIQLLFFRYIGNNSGAYCFNTDGKEYDLMSEVKFVTLITGSKVSQVKVHHKLFSHTITLYNTSSLQGQTVHIENVATLLSPNDHDTELMMRINTDIQNTDFRYFTDSNGFQLVSRKFRKHLPIGANFYPFTTMAVIEDANHRLTLHTAQPLGIGSFSTGSLEVMLDRVPMSSGKGLEEPVKDNKPSISKFIIQIEHIDGHHIHADYRKYQVHPSITSHVINDLLQQPIVSLYSITSTQFENKEFTFLEPDNLPCDIYIANIRSMFSENASFLGTGMTLHKRLTSCNIIGAENMCSYKTQLNFNNFFKDLELGDVRQMSLSYIHNIKSVLKNNNIIIQPMELESFLLNWKS